jgi:hypothetical protein
MPESLEQLYGDLAETIRRIDEHDGPAYIVNGSEETNDPDLDLRPVWEDSRRWGKTFPWVIQVTAVLALPEQRPQTGAVRRTPSNADAVVVKWCHPPYRWQRIPIPALLFAEQTSRYVETRTISEGIPPFGRSHPRQAARRRAADQAAGEPFGRR